MNPVYVPVYTGDQTNGARPRAPDLAGTSTVFDSDYIWCCCDIVDREDKMNHASINTSAIFGI